MQPYMMGQSQMDPAWPGFTNPLIQPAVPTIKATDIPKVEPWLEYCDKHPNRSGDNLADLAWHFERESFHRIDQFVGASVSVEKLSKWLGIGKGKAVLVIKYAEEDMELVRRGAFKME